jgi:hypothetical protein
MLLCLAMGIVSAAGPAAAGPYGDDLAKCLVASSTSRDHTDFVRWMFSGLSVHPDVANMANITPSQRGANNKAAGALTERLLLKDCRSQTVNALKYEGEPAVMSSFKVFGEVAARGLMNHEMVNAELGKIGDGINEAEWAAAFKEAGVRTAP